MLRRLFDSYDIYQTNQVDVAWICTTFAAVQDAAQDTFRVDGKIKLVQGLPHSYDRMESGRLLRSTSVAPVPSTPSSRPETVPTSSNTSSAEQERYRAYLDQQESDADRAQKYPKASDRITATNQMRLWPGRRPGEVEDSTDDLLRASRGLNPAGKVAVPFRTAVTSAGQRRRGAAAGGAQRFEVDVADLYPSGVTVTAASSASTLR